MLRDHVDEGGTRRWLHTGDLGYLDEDGYLFIVDRKKDLIKTSGFQVWPREIEEVLASHPAVSEVGVAGIAGRSQRRWSKAWSRAPRGTQMATKRSFAPSAACASRAMQKFPRASRVRVDLPKSGR